MAARARRTPLPLTLLAVAAALPAVLQAPPAGAQAPAATVHPDADAHVQQGLPDGNEGTLDYLQSDGSPRYQVFLRFTVSDPTVASASLRLYATNGAPDAGQVYRVEEDAWLEIGITWRTKPRLGPAVASMGAVTANAWEEVDLSSYVLGPGTYSVALGSPYVDGVIFSSREGAADRRPHLVITPGPADAAAPSAPGGVTATALSPLRAEVSWVASSDDVAVGGYTVYRSVPGERRAEWLGTTTETTFLDHRVQPGRTYRYGVAALDRAGRRSPFAVSGRIRIPVPTAPFVAAAGDIACDPASPNYEGGAGNGWACHMRHTSDLLLHPALDAVLALGDTQYEEGELADFEESYHPTWGRVKAITRPAVGNHEYGTPGAAGYYSYYGAAAGDPSTGYYSFDLGSWHVVVVNSVCTEVGGCHAGSPQELWLREDLAAHPAPCTLAYFHHPLFASGYSFGNITRMRAIWDALYAAGADVVLAGHEHTYERFGPQRPDGTADPQRGLREFVVGTGGKSVTGFDLVQPNSEVRSIDDFGVLQMVLRPGGYDWRFLPEAEGWFTDAGSAACH